LEKELIEEFGGTPTESYGPDGVLDGDPVEVRAAKKEDRFRVNCGTHDTLLEEGGSYIFDDVSDNQPPTEVQASGIDDDLTDCFSDRGYEHAFLDVDNVF